MSPLLRPLPAPVERCRGRRPLRQPAARHTWGRIGLGERYGSRPGRIHSGRRGKRRARRRDHRGPDVVKPNVHELAAVNAGSESEAGAAAMRAAGTREAVAPRLRKSRRPYPTGSAAGSSAHLRPGRSGSSRPWRCRPPPWPRRSPGTSTAGCTAICSTQRPSADSRTRPAEPPTGAVSGGLRQCVDILTGGRFTPGLTLEPRSACRGTPSRYAGSRAASPARVARTPHVSEAGTCPLPLELTV